MSTARWVLATAMVLAAMAGCSSTRQVDSHRVEDTMTTELQPHMAPERVTSVECPDRVPAEEGRGFTCAVTVGEARFDVAVTQHGAEGKLEFAPVDVVVIAEVVETDLAARLHEAYDEPGDVMELDVDCGAPRVRLLEVGDTFDCTVTAADSTFAEQVTVVDRSGTVSYRALE